MLFNLDFVKQAKEMYFLKKTKNDHAQDLIFNGYNIESYSPQKYLSHILDEKLSFDEHD